MFFKNNNKKNKGLTLLEMMLVLGIMTVIAVQQLEERMLMAQQTMARELGNELYQFSNGIRSALSQNYAAEATALGPNGNTNRNGTGWLRTSACGGGASSNYVPCNMGDVTKIGKFPLNTNIRESGGALIARTIIGPMTIEGEVRHDLASLAALTAAGGTINSGNPIAASASAEFRTDPLGAAVPLGFIEITVDTNGADDAWLRTDGTNTMNNNITFNPAGGTAFRGIQNLARLTNINNGGSNNEINFGSAIQFAGTTTSNRQIRGVDTIYNQYGNLRLQDNVDITGYIYNSINNVIVNDNLGIYGYLYDVNSSEVYVADSMRVAVDLSVNDDLIVNDDTWSYGDTRTYGRDYSYGRKYNNSYVYNNQDVYNYDYVRFYRNTYNYANSYNYNYMYVGDYMYVSNQIYAANLIDRNDGNYYVDPNGTSRLNSVFVNSMYASRYYDADNTTYYVDPNGYSQMYAVQATYIYGGPANWNYVGIYENYLGFYPNGYYSQYWQGYVNADNLWIQTPEYRGLSTSNRERLSYLLPRFVSKGIFRVYSGDYVEKPGCPYGTPKVMVTPGVVPIYSITPNCYYSSVATGNIGYNPLSYVSSNCYIGKSELRTYAYSSGSYWRVYSFSTPFYVHGYAMVQTYCQMY